MKWDGTWPGTCKTENGSREGDGRVGSASAPRDEGLPYENKSNMMWLSHVKRRVGGVRMDMPEVDDI